MLETIFKAYDIRGIYPNEINEDTVYKIARAFVVYLSAENIVIGRDARESSPALFKAFVNGATDQGCNIIDIGIVSTPIVYFASGTLDVDGAVSLTASHNHSQYNGLKLTLKNAIPLGIDSGLKEIKKLVEKNKFIDSANKGSITQHNSTKEYIEHFVQFAKLEKNKFKIVIDPGNGVGSIEIPLFKRLSKNIEVTTIFDNIDMSFPNHEANPLKTETLSELRRTVIKKQADLGISFDGDADRVGFIDEEGNIVPMDYITALLAKSMLETNPGSTILYDLRSTKSVKKIIEENGGKANECRVGHAFIKKQMRDEGAIFAGELSGHYYFKENFTAESASYAVILILNLMAKTGKTLSELSKTVQHCYQSGEINIETEEKEKVIDILKKTYKDGSISELDGVKITYPDWWFNVRISNTEPYLRVNIEANTKELLELKKTELLTIIQS